MTTNTYDSLRYGLVNRWDPNHLRRIDRLIPLSPDDRVLEIGCGQGHLTKRLADRGIDVVGIDANPNAAEIASTHRVRFMRAENLDFDDEVFDSVIVVHTIEHIRQLEPVLAEASRVLKPAGKALYIYPAEPIMGLYAIPASTILFGTPLRAREIHCQKLWPSKLRRMTAGLPMKEIHSEFNVLTSPQFISVFEKTN